MHLEDELAKHGGFKIESQLFLLMIYRVLQIILLLVLNISVFKRCQEMDVQKCGGKYGLFWKLLERDPGCPSNSLTCSHVRSSTFSRSIPFIAKICFLKQYAN